MALPLVGIMHLPTNGGPTENLPCMTRYTRHEVTSPRAVGPSGRTVLNRLPHKCGTSELNAVSGIRLGGHPAQGLSEVLLHLFTRNDGVEEAVLQQKFGPLKAGWELLSNRLLNDAGTGEANERAGFGDVQVA